MTRTEIEMYVGCAVLDMPSGHMYGKAEREQTDLQRGLGSLGKMAGIALH